MDLGEDRRRRQEVQCAALHDCFQHHPQYRSDAEIAKPVVYIGTPDGKAVTPTGKLVDNPIEAMVSDGFVNNIKEK